GPEPKDVVWRLTFRPGLFARAIRANQWMLIDELNRADVDKAFGELMTVLAGGPTALPYRDQEEEWVTIGHASAPPPSGQWTYSVAPTFRVIATMNTMDKGSLYQLSYALQRRFAIVELPAPDEAAMGEIIRRSVTEESGGA